MDMPVRIEIILSIYSLHLKEGAIFFFCNGLTVKS